MWYRAWIEVRWRMVLMLIVNGFIAALFLDDVASAEVWRHRLGNVMPMIFAMNGIVLAGSGVATQVSQRPGQVVHTSMLFLLSLPITRRQLVLVRQSVGALTTVFVVLATLLVMGFGAPELRGALSLGLWAAYVASVLSVVMVAYAVSAVLSTVLDQLWQTYAAIGVVGAVLGTVPGARVWGVVLDSGNVGMDDSALWMRLVVAGVFCAGIVASLFAASLSMVQRKQF